jgi:hypothetical protein
VQAWQAFRRVEDPLSGSTVRPPALAVAQRCEAEREAVQWRCREGYPRDCDPLPMPDGPLTVGIDGGDVREGHETTRPFEVMVGPSLLPFRRDTEAHIPSSPGLGFVQTVDPTPVRGVAIPGTPDASAAHRALCRGRPRARPPGGTSPPAAEPLGDWFHLTRRLTVRQQTATGWPDKTREEEDSPRHDPVVRELERLQGVLWPGNVYRAWGGCRRSRGPSTRR